MLRRVASLLAPALVALAALAFAPAAPALARTLEVTTTADDLSVGGSLRAALAAAASGDVVHVPAGRYVLIAELMVPAGVTVAGDGARSTTVSGGDASRVFETAGGGVVLRDLTIARGRAPSGGGVLSLFGLTLQRVAVLDNVADSGGGGGMVVSGSPPQRLLIEHSLIAGNRASGGGGGLFLTGSFGHEIDGSTVAGNSAGGGGGGIDVTAGSGLVLRGDTLFGNVAGPGGSGGNLLAGSPVFIGNTVLANGGGPGGNCAVASPGGAIASFGHNAQDTDAMPDATCQAALSRDPTNRAGLDLGLGALADNGGPTDTLLPGAASPLLDAGAVPSCGMTDQRGVLRPQGSGCDVGAVERTSPAIGAASADGITATSATLHGAADTVGLGGGARFAFGPTAGYGAFAAALGLPATAGVQGTSAQLTGLTPATTYHYRLLVTTPDGALAGADQTFTTAPAPIVQVPPPPPPPARITGCVVPRLTGLALSRARRALARAHCRLGTAKRPRARRGPQARRGASGGRGALVVRRQSRRAGSRLAGGTRVGVTLGPKPARRKPARHRSGR